MRLLVRVFLFVFAITSALLADTQTVTLPAATAGNGYAVRLVFKGFVLAMPYTVSTGTLPAGMIFDASTGLLTGAFPANQPSADLELAITLTDSSNNTIAISCKIHLNAAAAVRLARDGTALPSATVGYLYDVPLDAAGVGFNGPYTLAAAGPIPGAPATLPAGLALTAAGHIQGNPTNANVVEGDYVFPLQISAPGPNTVTWPVTLHLNLKPQVVTISPPTCVAAAGPAVIGTLLDQGTSIGGQASVPKNCTAKLRIWDATNRGLPSPVTVKALEAQQAPKLAIKTGADVAQAGTFSVTLNDPLIAGQTLYIEEQLLNSNGVLVSNSFSLPIDVVGFGDWGRVRAYFTSGILISQDQGSFSQSSLFLSFLLDKTWRMPGYYYGKHDRTPHLKWPPGFNTYFETRLTSVPVTACPAASASSNQCANGSFSTFLTSQKTALLQVGGYFPFTLTAWKYRGNANALFLAPLAKVGFDTPTSPINQNQAQGQSQGAGNTPGTPVTPVNNSNFYNFYAFGARTGHYSMTPTKDHAPELISHLDVAIGRFSNLESVLSGANGLHNERLWRVQLEGLLKVPSLPLDIGFSANIGQKEVGVGKNSIQQGPSDDLRFLFGTKFDLGKLMARINTTFQ